jgi:hypothetical protein
MEVTAKERDGTYTMGWGGSGVIWDEPAGDCFQLGRKGMGVTRWQSSCTAACTHQLKGTCTASRRRASITCPIQGLLSPHKEETGVVCIAPFRLDYMGNILSNIGERQPVSGGSVNVKLLK